MNYNILFSIQLSSIVLYMTFIFIRFKFLPSISDSWYSLKQNSKVLFTLFIWSISIPMMMYADKSPLFFLSGALLSFVGAATMFKDGGMTGMVHNVGAIGGILSALAALAVNHIYYPAIVSIISIVPFIVFKIKNKILWIEIISVVMIIFGIAQMIGLISFTFLS